jgi:hypothetical protein
MRKVKADVTVRFGLLELANDAAAPLRVSSSVPQRHVRQRHVQQVTPIL